MDFDVLKINLAVLIIVYGLSALFTYLQQKITAQVAQRTIYDLREDVDRKIQRLPLNYYDTHTHGDILSRATTDIEQISTVIQQMPVQFITAAFTIVGIIIMMFPSAGNDVDRVARIAGGLVLVLACYSQIPEVLFRAARKAW